MEESQLKAEGKKDEAPELDYGLVRVVRKNGTCAIHEAIYEKESGKFLGISTYPSHAAGIDESSLCSFIQEAANAMDSEEEFIFEYTKKYDEDGCATTEYRAPHLRGKEMPKPTLDPDTGTSH